MPLLRILKNENNDGKLRFEEGWAPGEIVPFDDAAAEGPLAEGVAEIYKEPTPKEEKTKPEKKKEDRKESK